MKPIFTILTLYFSWRRIKIGLETEIPIRKEYECNDSINFCISIIFLHLWFRIPLKRFSKMNPQPEVKIIDFER